MENDHNLVIIVVIEACLYGAVQTGSLRGEHRVIGVLGRSGTVGVGNEKASRHFLVWRKRACVGGSGSNDGAREGVLGCAASNVFGRLCGSGSTDRQSHVVRTRFKARPPQWLAN